MVIDMHNKNKFTRVDSCKIDSVESIRQAIHIGEWTTSINLADTYYMCRCIPCRGGISGLVWRGVVRIPITPVQSSSTLLDTGALDNLLVQLSRARDKCKEVGTLTVPRIHFPGKDIRSGQEQDKSCSTQVREVPPELNSTGAPGSHISDFRGRKPPRGSYRCSSPEREATNEIARSQ